MSRWLPWSTSHLKHELCLEKAKELRASGKYEKVRVGYTITEGDQKYSKIYLFVSQGDEK